MRLRMFISGLMLAVAVSAAPTNYPALALKPNDRILVLAPHPDDESLACGGVIQQALARHLPVRVIFFTYGDNNELAFMLYRKHPVLSSQAMLKMGEVRHREALAAGQVLGLSTNDLVFLGYPDFGTLSIWLKHWHQAAAFKSMLTRVTQVAYTNARRPGAPYKGEEILRDLTDLIRDFKPTKIFLSHPADRNPDHIALYLFAQVAVWDLEKEFKPGLYPYLVHYRKWPNPRRLDIDAGQVPPERLTWHIAWQSAGLTPDQVHRKQQAIEAHKTQCTYGRDFLLAFVRRNELFGNYPAVVLRGAASEILAQDDADALLPEDLSVEDEDKIVNVEQRIVSRDQDQLVLTFKLARPVVGTATASIYAFGYRPDQPFESMPKLHVLITSTGYECYDQETRLAANVIDFERHNRTIAVRVPFAVLGRPARLLTAFRVYLGEQEAFERLAWRVIELP